MSAPPRLGERSSGLLLHPTSLPGPHGSGDIGMNARAFVDFLHAAKQRWWQMLPVVPPGSGHSPYSAQSAFAGNPMLIDLEALAEEGLLEAGELQPTSPLSEDRLDFEAAHAHRDRALRLAYRRFVASGTTPSVQFKAFLSATAAWLEPYALWCALKRAHGDIPWTAWPQPLRQRERSALSAAKEEHRDEVGYVKFVQYLFARQWEALRAYCAERGVGLIGDIPIFVAQDSADVWHARDVFRVDENGIPTVVSGVPPDYFSATGQRWGNPLYRWQHLRKSGYAWWLERFRTTLGRFDAVRLDHFIGFARYWEVPAGEKTAENGRWMRGPGADFFNCLREALGRRLPLIAEDLGAVTPRVFALRDEFKLPGTKILQYAFGNDPNAEDFQPHSFGRRSVVYTGTHDNDTTVGWFHDAGCGVGTRSPEQIEAERENAMRYLPSDGTDVHWAMIRVALASVASTAIVPLQDVLGLTSSARMNTPGVSEGNWAWRFRENVITSPITERLRSLTQTYGRSPAQRVEVRTRLPDEPSRAS